MGRLVEQITESQYRAEERTRDGLLVVQVQLVPSPSPLEADPLTGHVGTISADSLAQQILRTQAPERDVRTVLQQTVKESGLTVMTHVMGDHTTHGQLLGGLAAQGENVETVGILAQQGTFLPLAPGVRVRARVQGHFEPGEASQLITPAQPLNPGSQKERLLRQWASGSTVTATTEALAEIAAQVGEYQQGPAKVHIKIR